MTGLPFQKAGSPDPGTLPKTRRLFRSAQRMRSPSTARPASPGKRLMLENVKDFFVSRRGSRAGSPARRRSPLPGLEALEGRIAMATASGVGPVAATLAAPAVMGGDSVAYDPSTGTVTVTLASASPTTRGSSMPQARSSGRSGR